MKNKFIVVMALIVFGYKSSKAQIQQSTIKPIAANTINVSVPQYSVTLTEDTTYKRVAPNANSPVRDDYYYPYYNLLITGMPKDTAYVSLQLFEKYITNSPYTTTPLQTAWNPIILDNNGYAFIRLNQDVNRPDNHNYAEQSLYSLYQRTIMPRIKWMYVGANHYKFNVNVHYKNKNLRDKDLDSYIIF
jgi:hypothetical protein